MNDHGYPYDESLLQWIWQHLEFDTQSLQTECGNSVQIIYPGSQNHGAGPDFSDTIIRIGGAEMHGDVELHIYPEGWIQHRHSISGLFNRVILHVVYNYGKRIRSNKIVRPDGTSPPLLILKPHLQKSLQSLFEQKKISMLPCAGNLNFINQRAFEQQIEKAHHDYFEFKTNFLLNHYRPDLPVSKAWMHMFTFGIFHTLGIPVNRDSMVNLHKIIAEINFPATIIEFADDVSEWAFSGSNAEILNWNHSGMRPPSRPHVRVRQAAAFYFAVNSLSLKDFLSPDLTGWKKVIQSIPSAMLPGSQMRKILKQTIYLPAAFLLGDLLHSQKLKANAFTCWRNIQGGVPDEVISPFKDSGFNLNKHTRKPGLAHQLKRYCRPVNCHQCMVFKKAISS